MMRADPLLRGVISSDFTSAQAIGTMMAVRTVMEGIPNASTRPITKTRRVFPSTSRGKAIEHNRTADVPARFAPNALRIGNRFCGMIPLGKT